MKDEKIKQKIQDARSAIEHGLCFFCFFGSNPIHLVDEFMQLNIDGSEDIWPLVLDLLKEIAPKHYLKADTNSKNIANPFNRSEICMFSWNSKRLKGSVFLQFALSAGYFYYLSIQQKTTQLTVS